MNHDVSSANHWLFNDSDDFWRNVINASSDEDKKEIVINHDVSSENHWLFDDCDDFWRDVISASSVEDADNNRIQNNAVDSEEAALEGEVKHVADGAKDVRLVDEKHAQSSAPD